jgi:DNA-binding response OmpR family regulator
VPSYAAQVVERILVVEDDATIGSGLVAALEANGYTVAWAKSGGDGMLACDAAIPDLVLLDLGLPDLDGTEVCRRVRRAAPDSTIVMLTARRDELDVILALEAGADDYLTKPFRLAELLARIRAHLRRTRPTAPPDQVRVGELLVDRAARRVTVEGLSVELRAKEFDLLAMLAAEAGRVVTRERLMGEVWDEHWFGSTKTLDTHVSTLRQKLAAASGTPSRITTLRGVGYRLEAE